MTSASAQRKAWLPGQLQAGLALLGLLGLTPYADSVFLHRALNTFVLSRLGGSPCLCGLASPLGDIQRHHSVNANGSCPVGAGQVSGHTTSCPPSAPLLPAGRRGGLQLATLTLGKSNFQSPPEAPPGLPSLAPASLQHSHSKVRSARSALPGPAHPEPPC